MINLKGYGPVVGWLLALGGIQLGLMGLVGFDLLGSILGSGSVLERAVLVAVGVAAVVKVMRLVGGKGKK
ncbi:MAG: hypothetical protein ACD_30C00017G0005 [uncultured bacterium]|uniref:Uncharacterized protein n=4 Tax=Candidatus Daviesiibacteriota TaxID=1752718 RepID=A0A0G0I082_9BACT|nr:MAG: hypothetical protein ACD_30C00017G0005 [uncultured bacterium]KKQ09531.1 MAG: hypothetical protein US19_C0013G0005 [Candidatus Daviesbacteria bacterium GW2011_GWB1_36_5]KKQ15587.1 MAG: hypothetical protein US28_C0014G0030 [Candidatus Daviesbacteria bacterium GW2011_GWA1_36_8]OGE17522.1 MAG: hypothetical protein A2858_01305 [Candidatus Daviesbacteria bacterium RIFCSPHIGHO2_01_FULL_36_37]OGE36616.1 MAG: hypothetical protein A3E66_03150 [Candidatus Daviesbacteria bacterium RIFCSPHIGHO2_12_F